MGRCESATLNGSIHLGELFLNAWKIKDEQEKARERNPLALEALNKINVHGECGKDGLRHGSRRRGHRVRLCVERVVAQGVRR